MIGAIILNKENFSVFSGYVSANCKFDITIFSESFYVLSYNESLFLISLTHLEFFLIPR